MNTAKLTTYRVTADGVIIVPDIPEPQTRSDVFERVDVRYVHTCQELIEVIESCPPLEQRFRRLSLDYHHEHTHPSSFVNRLVDNRGPRSGAQQLILRALRTNPDGGCYNSRSFDIVSPEGDSIARAQTKKGVDANVAWGGNSTIAKAISIFRDGDVANISQELGNKHKVRNFYNNILVPNSKNGHVTIDTHAVAAALLRALSGNSLEVKHNFGGTSNAISGLQGTYALYEEAYRRAAKELGLLPRELQSITWEAIRGMYTPGFKSQSKNVDGIDKIWNQFKKGRLSYDGAREYALETAGGIEAPSWLGRDPGIYVEEQLAAEPDDVSGDGVSGGNPEDIVIRADVDDSGATAQSIRKSPDRDGAGLDSGRSDSQGAGPQDGAGGLAPLPGYSHWNVKDASGPDQRLVQVAEKYARDHGIDLHRQAEYVEVDPERAERIAAAYAAMPHEPNNPKVKAAYADLIKQTRQWIEYGGDSTLEPFLQRVRDWLNEKVNWSESDYFDTVWNGQAAAFSEFEDLPQAILKALGVRIVDGDMPGSNYQAVELRKDLEAANQAAEVLGLDFRFVGGGTSCSEVDHA